MSDLNKMTGQLNHQLVEVLRKGLGGLVLLVTAARELNLRRREFPKPSLNQDYAYLFLTNTHITD